MGFPIRGSTDGFLFKEGYFFLRICFRFLFFVFPLLASWLRGFLASWLLGCLASWLLGFLASQLLGFSASWLWPFVLLFLDVASRIISITSSSLFESSLLRTSWGRSPPPQPTRYCLDCLQSGCTRT